ncbi:MAG TPA: hypothetical protein VJQ50_14840 [Terriglobales bacterium]|nr:hypothetical protein [Terriglobales bacterium]
MRGLLGIAAASNLGVAVTTVAIQGWNSGGAHAAARNTARFSCLWFVAAFAAPGLARMVRGLPAGARLVRAFVAAHLVHFAVVAALIASFERAHLAEKPGQSAAVLLIGFSLVVGLGITAMPRVSRLYTSAHRGMLYLVFLIFFLAFAHNAVKPLRLMAVLLAGALLLRLAAAAQNLWNPQNAR